MAWKYQELIDSFIEECEEYKLQHQSPSEAVVELLMNTIVRVIQMIWKRQF